MNKISSKNSNVSKFVILEEMKNINLTNESLRPIEPEIDTISMFQKLKELLNDKNTNWTEIIGVINYLRRLNKYEKSSFNQFLFGLKMYPKLLELINSVRSSLSKNVLVLLHEIFSESISENKNAIIALIKSALPYLISKANSNQSFIKNESMVCLKTISKIKDCDILLVFIQLLNNKINKVKDDEFLAELSIEMIKNLGKELLVETPEFNELIKYVTSFYEMNKINHVKICRKILNSLIEVMKKDNFDCKIEKCGRREKNDVKTILNEKINEITKKKRAVSTIHFRKNISENKKNLKLSKLSDFSFDKTRNCSSIKIMNKTKEAKITNFNNVLNNENIQKNN